MTSFSEIEYNILCDTIEFSINDDEGSLRPLEIAGKIFVVKFFDNSSHKLMFTILAKEWVALIDCESGKNNIFDGCRETFEKDILLIKMALL